MNQVTLMVTMHVTEEMKPAELESAVRRVLTWVLFNDVDGAEVLAFGRVGDDIQVTTRTEPIELLQRVERWMSGYGTKSQSEMRQEVRAALEAVGNMTDQSRDAFNYQLLSRLQQDCEYYMGFGARDNKRLWAQDEAAQIQKMKALYAALPEKPEWITPADIERYEAAMCSPVSHRSGPR